ncbi:hypothetical protein HELRODRAFT_183726 [Helobdella robusta]|uniref:Uncharacterized protein n=1 Tax=Helobdella robusta TaxID=6412 RepID=T1FK41_HELRO|nr:hypothetical protein HELRODRAFT_183726 [Helobdella robusta]ESO10353.1 hypothetical protein HELRODRAFT_183726 [Helobdella robusta]
MINNNNSNNNTAVSTYNNNNNSNNYNNNSTFCKVKVNVRVLGRDILAFKPSHCNSNARHLNHYTTVPPISFEKISTNQTDEVSTPDISFIQIKLICSPRKVFDVEKLEVVNYIGCDKIYKITDALFLNYINIPSGVLDYAQKLSREYHYRLKNVVQTPKPILIFERAS